MSAPVGPLAPTPGRGRVRPRWVPRPPAALLQVGAALAVVVAVTLRLGTGAVLDGLRAVSPAALLAALGIGVVTTAASAARWCVVARALGLSITFTGALGGCYRAQFLNSVLPAGVLGDVWRAVDHGRRGGDVRRGVQAVVIERGAGQAVVVVCSLIVLTVLPSPLHGLLGALGNDGPAGLLGALTTATAVLLGLAGIPRVRRELSRWATGIRQGVLAVRTGPAVLALSLAAMAGHLALLAVAARTVGVTVGFAQLAPLLVLSLLAMALPINVGGWGPREAVTAIAFGAAGLGAGAGLATAVAFGVLALGSTLPGLGVLALGVAVRQRRRARSRAVVPAARGRPAQAASRATSPGATRRLARTTTSSSVR